MLVVVSVMGVRSWRFEVEVDVEGCHEVRLTLTEKLVPRFALSP